ncbi:MAG: hypothetical protein R3F59_18585 [Myxococcota bacterium]
MNFGRWMAAALLAAGCSGAEQGQVEGGPTYNQDVAPILAEHCGACHQDGGIAPFSVATYAQASPWADAIVASVDEGRMPPFFAVSDDECDMQIGFQDDNHLSDDEKQLLHDWADAGAPEGEPAGPAALPAPDHLDAPDAVLSLQSPYEVTGDRDIYRCFRVEVGNTEDVWITGLEVIPDNDLVVHHVLVWNDPEDQSAGRAGADGSYPCSGEPDVWPTELVAAWTPGGSPMRAPDDAGTLFHPGASLVVNVHYHPTGTTTEIDQSQIALKWTKTQPAHHTTWYLVDIPFGAHPADGKFEIPAGASDHTETVSLEIPTYVPWDLTVFAITPHMHYLGNEMLVTLHHGGDDECLVHTPGYRFDFQTSYLYDPQTGSLPVISPGDTIDVRCTYDNSRSNPYLDLNLQASGADEPQTVWWGEETSDEMCMAMVGLVIPPVDWLDLAGAFF